MGKGKKIRRKRIMNEIERGISLGCDNETKPDKRPIPVADRWAGAEIRVFTLFDSCSRTNGRTNGRTDGRTKALIELRVRN